jgi:hypothetical protein
MKEERGEGELLSSEVTLMAVVGRKGGPGGAEVSFAAVGA